MTIGHIVAAVLVELPFLWLLWTLAYHCGRDAGVLAERSRWTSEFQGKGHPDTHD